MESLAIPSIGPNNPPLPHAQVTVIAGQTVDPLTQAVRNALQDSFFMRGAVCEAAFQVPGFSGRKFRLLLNNLMNELADPRYLEIGVYHGASFCSAIYLNQLRAVGIDNWSKWDGERSIFEGHLAKFTSDDTDVQIIEADFREVNYDAIGKFNVMFYDGAHDERAQYEGVLIPTLAMDDRYVLIVDDWNWQRVRKGTLDALADGGLIVDYSIEIRTSFNDQFPPVHGPASEWHNGAFIAVISKP